MTRLSISLLGSFQVKLGQNAVTQFESDKVRALLSYLVAEADQPHSRSYLAGLLWPDLPEQTARKNLSQALYNLRQAIGDQTAEPPFLDVSHQTIQFNQSSNYWLDLTAFAAPFRNSKQADLAALQTTIDLYRGDFMSGFSLADSELFEEWILLKQQELRQLASEALKTLTLTWRDQGDFDQSLHYARRQLELEAWDETAHAQVMELLAFTGQRNAALHHYDLCRRLLEDELGVSPGDELNALYHQIQQGQLGWEAAPEAGSKPQNPYKGLQPFQEGDVLNFFGRQQLIEQLLAQLLNDEVDEDPDGWMGRFLGVIGPSGSGKSSLVRAGLIPGLRQAVQTSGDQWHIIDMFPGADPMAELAAALARLPFEPVLAQTNGAHSVQSVPNLQTLEDGQALRAVLERRFPNNAPQADSSKILLFIDQFEELFTLVRSESIRTGFLANLLGALAAPRSRLHLIITLRTDFYDQLLHYPEFGRLLHRQAEVAFPLSPQELERAIAGPVERLGFTLEPGLVAAIVADVSRQPGALPLLQYALTELFEQQTGRKLTLAAYHNIGGVAGALTRRANELYNGLTLEAQEVARQLFLRLITLGEGAADTRRRAPRAELLSLLILAHKTHTNGSGPTHVVVPNGQTPESDVSQTIETIIDRFSQYRLFTLDQNIATGQATVEVAHEALIQHWPQVKQWLQTSRADVQLHRRLMALAAEWEQADRDVSFLMREGRLQQFEVWADSTNLALTPLETNYLQASVSEREAEEAEEAARQAHERQLEQRSQRRLRLLVIVLLTATVGAFALSAVAFTQRQIAQEQRDRAETQTRLATSGQLAAQAINLVDIQYDLALLLSLEANLLQDTLTTRGTLLEVLSANPGLVRYLPGHTGGVNSVQFSPDGRFLASAGSDHLVMLWDMTAEPPQATPLQGHTDLVWQANFSPDGQILASVSFDGTIILWDVREDSPSFGQPLGSPLTSPGSAIGAAVFSQDGQTLISADDNGQLIMWNVRTQQMIGVPVSAHNDAIFHITLSPDGGTLVFVGFDGKVIVWPMTPEGLAEQPLNLPLLENQDTGGYFTFSPDGQILASASLNEPIILWDMSDGASRGQQLTAALPDQAALATSLTFSPDGQQLISGSDDGRILFWDVDSTITNGAPPTLTLTGHDQSVWGLTFSPDGQTLVSSSIAGEIIVWDMAAIRGESSRLGQSLSRPTEIADRIGPVTWGQFNQSGQMLALGSETGHVEVASLTAAQGANQSSAFVPFDLTFTDHSAEIAGLAFSADDQYLVSSDIDGEIRVWDLSQSRPAGTIFADDTIQHTDEVWGLAFNPDTSVLASGSVDETIILWDVSTRQPLGPPLSGHTAGISNLAFSPDGQQLASASDDWSVRLWSVDQSSSGESLFLSGHENIVFDVAFSPMGRYVASASGDSSLNLWDAVSGEQLGLPFNGHTQSAQSVTFSPDGQWLASGDFNGDIILWNVATRQPIGAPLTAHTSEIIDLAFSPDGQTLYSLSFDGQAIAWQLDAESWQDEVCRVAGRSLTEAEWVQYLGDMAYRGACE